MRAECPLCSESVVPRIDAMSGLGEQMFDAEEQVPTDVLLASAAYLPVGHVSRLKIMNWRRWLFRLWLVGTALFVIAVAFISYGEIKKQFDAIAAEHLLERHRQHLWHRRHTVEPWPKSSMTCCVGSRASSCLPHSAPKLSGQPPIISAIYNNRDRGMCQYFCSNATK